MPIDAVKPSTLPRWATTGGTRLEPSEGQKDSGWTNGQRPPYNVMNWLQGLIYDWQQYLEDATDELDAEKLERHEIATEIGADGATPADATLFLDHLDNTTGADETTAAVIRQAWRLGDTPSAQDGFDLSVWRSSSGTSEPTMRLRSVVNDAYNLILFTAGKDDWQFGPVPVRFQNPAGDASTTARANTLVPRNVPKAWAYITITDDAGAGDVVVVDGFNVASVDCADFPASGWLKVTWAQDFLDTNYIVIAQPVQGDFANFFIEAADRTGGSVPKAAGSQFFQIKSIDDYSGKDLTTLGANTLGVYLIAFGRQ